MGNVTIAQTGTGVILYANDQSGSISGNIYIADANNSTIRIMTPAGTVTTLAGGVESVGPRMVLGARPSFGILMGLPWTAGATSMWRTRETARSEK